MPADTIAALQPRWRKDAFPQTPDSAIEREGKTRWTNVLEPDLAARLYEWVRAFDGWTTSLQQNGTHYTVTAEQRRALDTTTRQQLHHAACAQAARGFGYHFDSFPIDDALAAHVCPPELRAVHELINSSGFLATMRRLLKAPDIAFADCQLTRFGPGDFLTAHDDDVAGKNRVAAYVLSLTPNWRIDFGGMLCFHDEETQRATGLSPLFNALSVFTVPRRHSVSAVAPYANRYRYSFTGWLRKKR
ncbi:2OG-Fe(II) oxygenase [Yunchengibacter salinarum]|uniref:2OG-Fe(II) oxygenase n=1 Tax=Yunchengibacter salinarum TaxID=3133399 RepID=UPI0035B6A8B0